VKPSELRDKNDEELVELEGELRDQLVKLSVAKATQRAHNTAQFARIKKDIARVKTILHERQLGLGAAQKEAEA
jgi:large subunit ribosomal protein L29